MRGRLLSAGAVAISLVAGPAFADVNIDVNIFKFKDKDIIEFILKDKAAFLWVEVAPEIEKFAESDLQINQTNFANTIFETLTSRRDLITASVTGNNGLVSVNQAAGNLNNQGNAVSAAVNTEAGGPSFAEAQANVDQENNFSPLTAINLAFRDASILDSVNDNTGVAHVNQSVGDFNNQANALSMAISLDGGGVVLTEADLGQTNIALRLFEANATRASTLTGSVLNNTGVVGVNQASGNYANQGNVVAFGAAITM